MESPKFTEVFDMDEVEVLVEVLVAAINKEKGILKRMDNVLRDRVEDWSVSDKRILHEKRIEMLEGMVRNVVDVSN